MKTLLRFLLLLGCFAMLTVSGTHSSAAEAEALNQQVIKLYEVGKYKEAFPIAQQVLDLREKVLGPDHSDTATSLNNLGLLYQATGDYVKAEPLFQRALKILEKVLGPDHPDTNTSLNNLAWLYKAMGDYTKAEPLQQRVLKIREKVLGPDHPDTATSLNNLGLLYLTMGDYAKAEPVLQRALKILEKALGPDHPNTAASLNSLAAFYQTMGDYTKAEPFYQRALKIREKALGPDHPDTNTSLNNLAWLYLAMGDYAKAEPFLQRALKGCEKTLGLDHPNTATILDNLGWIYLVMGDAKAEPLRQRALKIREKVLGPDHPDTAASLNNLGFLYRAMGDYAKAEPFFQRALKIWEKVLGPDHPTTAGSLGNLSLINIDLSRPAEATKLAFQAAQAEEKLLGNILSFTSEQQRSAFQKTTNPYTLFASLDQAPALAQTLLRRKAVVLDSLLEDRLVAAASRDPAQRETLAQLASAKQRLMQLLLAVPKDLSDPAIQQRAGQKEALSKQVEELEASLARQVAGLGRTRRALSVTVPQVQAALASEQVLIEFVRYGHYLGKNKFEVEARYGAVVIGREGEPKWVVMGKADEIEKNLRLYQRCVRGQQTETIKGSAARGVKTVADTAGESQDATMFALLQALHQQLWAPIEKLLPAGTRTVILSPDGELNFLSFATLLTSDDHFLSEKYSIRYVASGRDLLREFQTAPKATMSIYANPDFEAVSGQPSAVSSGIAMRSLEIMDFSNVSLPQLPGTEREGTALAAELKQAGMQTELFLGPRATEAQLRQLNGPRILHLATHGFFLPDAEQGDEANKANKQGMSVVSPGGNSPIGGFVGGRSRPVALKNPMHRSGLALTGAQRTLAAWARGEVPPTDNDGILTAEEVGGLKLNGTWLVVLSACDTGTGEARAGEGVMGLRRGFIQAGAQNLLMTLWPVADEETVKLMTDFYAAAQRTGNAPQTLADVQRDWLARLRKERGLQAAVRLAGPFIMSSQGKVE